MSEICKVKTNANPSLEPDFCTIFFYADSKRDADSRSPAEQHTSDSLYSLDGNNFSLYARQIILR